MAKGKKILILSPHMDDAIFSCGEHIYRWRKNKYEITVCNIFTNFISSSLSDPAIDYLAECGYVNLKDFDHQRKNEDEKAMHIVKIKAINLGLTDALFRSGAPNLSSVKRQLKELNLKNAFTKVVVPYGLGGHKDHLLTRQVAEATFSKNKIFYYLEEPYASKRENWSPELCRKILKTLKSIAIPLRKMPSVYAYTSQLWILPSWFRFMPEIIFSPSP